MSRPLSAALSAKWLVLSQALLAVLQFGYGAVTARIFVPEQFGSFIAAISLQGILVLAATTGVPSYALAQESLARHDKLHLRMWAEVGGLAAAVGYWLLAPYWFDLMNAQDELAFRYIMAFGCLVLPMAALESAFMRRNRNGRQDALVIFFGFVIGAAIALAGVLVLREVWALALQPLSTAAITTILSLTLQAKETPQRGRMTASKSFFHHSSLVTGQNLLYSIFQQAPGWIIGAIGGSAALGTYSRAHTLAGTPGTGIATGINRAIQPRWARMATELRDSALADTTVIIAAVGFPLFGGLVTTAAPIVVVWLGPGWEETIPLAKVLAVGFGLHLVLAVLTSNAEMLKMHGLIRKVQACMALALGVTIGVGVWASSPLLIAAAIATTNLAGLLAFIAFREWESSAIRGRLVRHLGRSFLITAVMVAVCSTLLALFLHSDSALVRLIWSALSYVLIWAAASRFFRIGHTLTNRGIRTSRFIYN